MRRSHFGSRCILDLIVRCRSQPLLGLLSIMQAHDVNLEFDIELPPGISENDLAERLRARAGLLHKILAQPVLEMHVGSEPVSATHGGDAMGRSSSPRRGRSVTSDLEPRFDLYERGRSRSHSPSSSSRPGVRSAWGDIAGRRPLSAREGASLDQFNHPTSTQCPSFLLEGGYWQQRKGSRIAERKLAEDLARKEREQSAPAPFRARPVPPSVTAPLYQGVQAVSRLRRSRSAEGGRRRGRMDGEGMDLEMHEEHQGRESSLDRAPFRARPVPWCVSAPLYDQMLIEDQHRRQEKRYARSRANMRASSLPPRLEAVRARLCGNDHVNRANTPVAKHAVARAAPPSVRVVNRPLQAEIPRGLPQKASASSAGAMIDAAETLSRDVAAGVGMPGGPGYGMANMHGSTYGISHLARHKTPTQKRAQSAERSGSGYNTTEVPDFAALHEREKAKLERLKYQNRYVTQPAPFVLSAPGRATRNRQPPLPKDPSYDPRWHRSSRAQSAQRRQARSSSTPGSAVAAFTAGAERSHFSVAALEKPPVLAPPRSTDKTLAAQQHTSRRLLERRLQEQQKQQELEEAHQAPSELKARVVRAIGPMKSGRQYVEEQVERRVMDRQQDLRKTVQEQRGDLKRMQERVARRPLLMEQTDSLARARRRALFQFRRALQDAGAKDADTYFEDDELDECDRARMDRDFASYGA
mmetsp:Transcript_52684/g.83596  ORF Transcript_52684/g.83596 Transcript_52684/m.83596 type:complete len:697 (+) Transcript_52684:1-2091(+)